MYGYEFNPMYQQMTGDGVFAMPGIDMIYEELTDGEEEQKPSLIKPLGAALMGALLGGWITDAFPLPGDDQRTQIQKSQKMTAAFLASGFVGLLIGMIGR